MVFPYTGESHKLSLLYLLIASANKTWYHIVRSALSPAHRIWIPLVAERFSISISDVATTLQYRTKFPFKTAGNVAKKKRFFSWLCQMGKRHLEMKMPESHRVVLLLLVLGGLQLHSSSTVSDGQSWNKQKATDCLSKEDLHFAASYGQNTVLQYACYFTTRKLSTIHVMASIPGFSV